MPACLLICSQSYATLPAGQLEIVDRSLFWRSFSPTFGGGGGFGGATSLTELISALSLVSS